MTSTGAEKMLIALVLALGIGGFSTAPYGAEGRSSAVITEFKRSHQCPVDGPGSCFERGYVIDHWVPFCLGKVFDRVDNLLWMKRDEAQIKDGMERSICQYFKRPKALLPE